MTASSGTDALIARIQAIQSTLPSTVRLIGVTKRHPASVVRAAYVAGLRDFGESQVQEAITKQADLTDLENITWHLIGHLQANKARKAVLHFDWIHSVDSLKLAQRLNDLAAEVGRSPRCCLQVKLVPDPPKFGFSREELWEALPILKDLTHLKVVGLMIIPPQESSAAAIADIFQAAYDLKEKINQSGFDPLRIQELSMGMSGDYPIAIAAGSTMVRLGTTLFGDRPA